MRMEGQDHDGVRFSDALQPVELEALLSAGRLQLYRSGDVIFHQGDPTRHVVLLVGGAAKVSVLSTTGREVMLALRGPGDILGEMAAVSGLPRTARVTALGPVRGLNLPPEAMDLLLKTYPHMSSVLLLVMAARLQESDRHRLDLAARSVRGRVAGRILDLADEFGRPIEEGVEISARLSQQDIADWTSASREAVAQALRRFRARGAITTGRMRIVVLRRDLLHAEVR